MGDLTSLELQEIDEILSDYSYGARLLSTLFEEVSMRPEQWLPRMGNEIGKIRMKWEKEKRNSIKKVKSELLNKGSSMAYCCKHSSRGNDGHLSQVVDFCSLLHISPAYQIIDIPDNRNARVFGEIENLVAYEWRDVADPEIATLLLERNVKVVVLKMLEDEVFSEEPDGTFDISNLANHIENIKFRLRKYAEQFCNLRSNDPKPPTDTVKQFAEDVIYIVENYDVPNQQLIAYQLSQMTRYKGIKEESLQGYMTKRLKEAGRYDEYLSKMEKS